MICLHRGAFPMEPIRSPDMIFFEEYVHELESYASAALAGKNQVLEDVDFTKLLNGGVGLELRRRVALELRQQIGAFFTGEALRQIAFGAISNSSVKGPVWDPACGAGDLLLSYAEKLPILPDIGDTITSWGNKLYGNDIQGVFLRAAKARLVLAAFARGARNLDGRPLSLNGAFPNILQQDSLLTPREECPTDVVLNPPFISIIASCDCAWGSGSLSAAAAFVDMCLKVASSGTRIIAILPDVLRTGTRYERWRKMVAKHADVKRVDIYGPFDPQADVDVFILELHVRHSHMPQLGQESPWGLLNNSLQENINNYFSVSVGPVVPHRHREEGPELAFLHSRDATPWGTLDHLAPRRRFSGTIHYPPFVVIRRTSSPSDRNRAIGTIINCTEPVAVENHLVVCKPNDGRIESCQSLLEVLKSSSTNEWLNNRIRCRHLTVGAVKEIPFSYPLSPSEESSAISPT